MEQSTLHIKAPHDLHIAIKVAAMESDKSMNQFVVDTLAEYIGVGNIAISSNAIKVYRNAASEKPIVAAVCKVHGTPLTINGKCLQKGCKYA